MQREATFADPLAAAIRRHENAVERLRNVAHYVDRDVMGRAPTAAEMAEFQARGKAAKDALHAICALPCPDFKMLRRKCVYLVNQLGEGGLLQRDQRTLLGSILHMSRSTDVA
jgi:hypothetical protein